VTRVSLETAVRAGSVALLTAYATSAGVQLQVYPSRVKQAKPPTAYVEAMTEQLTEYTLSTRQRNAQARIRCLWGLFDSGEAVKQRDKFVDGFLDWVADNYHAFGTNTLVEGVTVSDDPEFVFESETYFSSVITLGGFAAT